MNEPTTTSVGLQALFVALLGPLAGEHAVIVFAALAGALWPLSNTEGMTTGRGAMFLLRLVLTASVLTGIIAWWASKEYGIESSSILAPVAFGIGVIGDSWRVLFAKGVDLVMSRLGRAKEDKEGQQ